MPDGSAALSLYKGMFSRQEADAIYEYLLTSDVSWMQHFHEKFRYGKAEAPKQPRLTASFAVDGKTRYDYSDVKQKPQPFSPTIQLFVDRCKTVDATNVDNILANRYVWAAGHHIAEHRDSPKGLDPHTSVLSASFGSPGRFKVYLQKRRNDKGKNATDNVKVNAETKKADRQAAGSTVGDQKTSTHAKKSIKKSKHKTPKRKALVDVLVEHGDLLVMHGPPRKSLPNALLAPGMQDVFTHAVPCPGAKELSKWNAKWPQFDRRFNLTGRESQHM